MGEMSWGMGALRPALARRASFVAFFVWAMAAAFFVAVCVVAARVAVDLRGEDFFAAARSLVQVLDLGLCSICARVLLETTDLSLSVMGFSEAYWSRCLMRSQALSPRPRVWT